ncbi:uncharacterized protein LOC106143321 [Amyelois transitella]|uniref:uncharacterized protein LOC106143321 n=1 Tax=Amyelois transitella TaxID=680683 RepID=UPI00298F8B5F|nr:uncharacterized protein LOC106143321 [Amyelois transitella]
MMIINKLSLLLIYQTLLIEIYGANDNYTSIYEEGVASNVLSRRKRYLIFPEGSSLQLVFCVQTAALIPIGDIFLYGNTAALAWNLPTDPKLFFMFDKEAMRRADVANTINYVDERGKVIGRVPYKRKPIINPAFAKRSVDEPITYKEKLKFKIDRTRMHEKQLNRDYLKKEHMEPSSVEFHRSSRVGLFEKLEKLFTTLGQDGRQCVLYKLCEAAQTAPEQGTFLQEFLRVVFTLPKGSEFDIEDHREYDKAHNPSDDCSAKYPGCADFEIAL